MNSQFKMILQMENHEFSLVFLHYLLSRQLVTKKENELWWVFAGKPIRYGIQDFAVVTGLKCGHENEEAKKLRLQKLKKGKGKASTSLDSVWLKLFGGEKKPTASWIHRQLLEGNKYKDRVTRLRLALLLLVDGILCPISNNTQITKERVHHLLDLEDFMNYPWGRESFYLTVESTKSKDPFSYTQPTTSIQGFAHAMILVTVACCPPIVQNSILQSMVQRGASIEEIVSFISQMSLHLKNKTFRSLDAVGEVAVISLLSKDAAELVEETEIDDDKPDASVDYLLTLIEEDFPFEINSWIGGLRAVDVIEAQERQRQAQRENDESGSESDDADDREQGPDERPSRPKPSSHDKPAAPFDENLFVRKVAELIQEQNIPLFEGYTRSIITHIDGRIEKLLTDLKDGSVTQKHGDDNPLRQNPVTGSTGILLHPLFSLQFYALQY